MTWKGIKFDCPIVFLSVDTKVSIYLFLGADQFILESPLSKTSNHTAPEFLYQSIPLSVYTYIETMEDVQCGVPNKSYCQSAYTLVRSQKTRFRECFAKLILGGLKRFQVSDVNDHSVQLIMYTENVHVAEQLAITLVDDVCGAKELADGLPLKSIDFRQIDHRDVHRMGYTTFECRDCVYDHCEINEDDVVNKRLMMRSCPFVDACKATCETEITVEKLAGNIPPPVGYKPLK